MWLAGGIVSACVCVLPSQSTNAARVAGLVVLVLSAVLYSVGWYIADPKQNA